jgi:hypothetical protein
MCTVFPIEPQYTPENTTANITGADAASGAATPYAFGRLADAAGGRTS